MSLYEMRNTVAGRVAGTLAAFALVVSLSFGGALNAQAQTAEELQAQIAQLTALIAQLQSQIAGGTTSTPDGLAGYVFTRNLTPGSTGADVTMLQKFLNANGAPVATVGAGSPGNETAFYGPATGAAVKVYQELHRAEILAPLGLTVGTVNFGSSTRAYVNTQLASGTPTDPGTPGTGDSGELRGGEGDMVIAPISAGETVGTGETETVYEFDVEAFDSDVAVNRVDFVFSADDITEAPAVPLDVVRPWVAFDEVVLLADGREVASASRERDYTRTGTDEWRLRFSGLDVVIEEDDVVEFALEVTAAGTIRNFADVGLKVNLDGEQAVRGVDALGLVIYDGAKDSDAGLIDFTDTYSDGSVRIRNFNSPRNNSLLNADDEELVLAFTAEARDSDINLETLTVSIPTGHAHLDSLELVANGRTVQTRRVTSNSVDFSFGRSGFDIRQDSDVELEVLATFKDVTGIQDVTVAFGSLVATNRNDQTVSSTGTLTRSYRVSGETDLAVEIERPVFSTQGGEEHEIKVKLTLENNTDNSIDRDDITNDDSAYFSYEFEGVTVSGPDIVVTDPATGDLGVGDVFEVEITFTWEGTDQGVDRSFTLTKIGNVPVAASWSE